MLGTLILSTILAQNPPAQVAQPEAQKWHTNYEQALAAAKKDNKPVMMFFTGSDWCGWCIKLKDEVFSKPEWKTWAKGVVLMELDFPRAKEQTAEMKAQNVKLRDALKIRGYPTVVFVNHEGKEVGRTGYMAGGPNPWIENAKKLTANKPAVDGN
jgi:protein disulfide-isomerase